MNSAICIVVDRLHAGMLGTYGNAWIRTPRIDRLASQSFTFDQAYADNPELVSFYWSCWQAASAAVEAHIASLGLIDQLARHGVHTLLMSDEPAVLSHPLSDHFAERIKVAADSETATTAKDVALTALGRLFGTAIDWLASAPPSFCLWLHARGMEGPWDAPRALRAQYAEEDDPVPPDLVNAPSRFLPDDYDPDELLGIVHAYSGQVSALDACVGALMEALAEAGRDKNTLVAFLSPRGFPLGEHRRLGACDGALYNELIQIPWLLRFPDGLGRMVRSQALAQPADLPRTVLDAWGIRHDDCPRGLGRSLMPLVRDQVGAVRDRIYFGTAAGERGIRTPGWYLRVPPDCAAELFAKPADRWEVNEVASRAPEVAAGLREALAQYEQGGQAAEPPPLEDALTREVD